MSSVSDILENERILVIVKPNAKKTGIVGIDENKGALLIELNAAPSEGKANKELIRFLHKRTKKSVRIAKGLKSREKIVEFG